MIVNCCVPYRGEFGNLLVIGESGLAFMERMLAKSMVAHEEMEKAYFWRVKTGLLNGKFDAQIQSAKQDNRMFNLDLDCNKRNYVARFKSFHFNTKGEIEAVLHPDFVSAYILHYDGGVASIMDTIDDPASGFGIQAFDVKSGGKEFTAITTSSLEYICWRHIKQDDSVKAKSDHPKVDRHFERFTDRLIYGRREDTMSLVENARKNLSQG